MNEVSDNLPEEDGSGSLIGTVPVSGMYENWFLDYASYVIMERAVPALNDGLKPVQRRILHAMREMDDGRFNKVANVIGQTMQYHPHGDASIGDAMVNLGQKELLIETQGNWGDIRTGDGAAAPRYIEGRLSKFALEVVFNPQTTEWQTSYDGRKREPVTLPVKFPLLLAQGVEGIAVGLATKILPHNFCELLLASIDVLRNKKVDLVPDFPTGGMADFSNYNDGLKGGRIRVRSHIEEVDKKTLAIRDIPYGTTTSSIIDSIIKANDGGKIKIKKVVDNTAKDVEILVSLAPGLSTDVTIDALYAFTACETSISPNCCVIVDDRPQFLSVNEILKMSTHKTVALLKLELEIRRAELMEKLLFSSLEKIFIENRIYRDIEECETFEAVIETIDRGLDPYKSQFYREITRDDILRLTEIKIKRISKFDSFKADELMRRLSEEMALTEHHLQNLTQYAIDHFKHLLEKYGKGRERQTKIRAFDTIDANVVAVANEKLYVNREDGFVGIGLRKEEYVCDCSDIDDIIIFLRSGKCMVTRVADKTFVGKDIIHVDVFRKGDERMVYNMIYVDGKSGTSRVKRFQVLSVTRDKEYDLTKGSAGSKVLYFSANPNGEAELITVYLTARAKARLKVFDFDFSELDIKGRGAGGNILTKYTVRKTELKKEGISTLGGVDIWFDDSVGRLNTDGRGRLLGNFQGDDLILVIYHEGIYELTTFELSNRFETSKIMLIEKYDSAKVISAIHFDGDQKVYLVKRFHIETTSVGKEFSFINEAKGSKLILATTAKQPQVEVEEKEGKSKVSNMVDLDMIVDVKGWRAQGNRLTANKILKVKLLADRAADDVEVDVKEEAKNEGEENENEDAGAEGFKAGSTVDFNVRPKKDDDQLGLF